jgi:RNA polymerase sigma factor (TIGR02999 family)
MAEVTLILRSIEDGDSEAAHELLPLVYAELRSLASQRMAGEDPAHTLQPTALVHEAFLRLVDVQEQQSWSSRGHFFSAAAEAMRRILVEEARRKATDKRGGGRSRSDLDELDLTMPATPQEVVDIHEGLTRLESTDAVAAQLVKLRFFGGFTIPEAADMLDMSPRKVSQIWTYARTWLLADAEERM